MTLETLLKNYQQHINDLISELNDYIVVFDFDGTLIEMQYNDKHILPCKETDLEIYCQNNNLYNNVRILNSMKCILSELNNPYILTRTVPSLIGNKNKFILENFDIKPDNIIHTKTTNEKLYELQNIYNKHHQKIAFIEDTAMTLHLAEENLDFVKGFHISKFII